MKCIYWTPLEKPKNYRTMILCRCICGTERLIRAGQIISARSCSCGCYGGPLLECKTERRIWNDLKSRCYNPNTKHWANYGGRGIGVCESWRTSFNNFFNDMGKRPGIGYSIDRIDNDGHYEPTNCRWATKQAQAWNRRSSRNIICDGKNLCVAEWAKITGLSLSAIYRRLGLGWSIEEALKTPLNIKRQNVFSACN